MIRLWIAAMLAVGLLLSGTAVFAQPATGHGVPDTERENTRTWGDPEEGEEADAGWTWFGMGYESRQSTSSVSRPTAGNGQAGSRSGHAGGQGKSSN